MSNYVWYALAALVGAFVSGVLVDRFTAHSMAVVTQLPLLISTIFLWFGDSRLTLVLFFIFFGLCSGMLQPMINSLLAERYGTRWLGEIKSLAMPLNVLASAVSPILMGLMIDAGSGLDDLMLILAATSIYSICITLLVFNLIGNISPKKR
jgi:MFS family permease